VIQIEVMWLLFMADNQALSQPLPVLLRLLFTSCCWLC
jgi:hypothetical protein